MTDDMLTVRQPVGFEDFYRAGYRHVYQLVWVLAGESAADELTQEVFVIAHRRWDEVKGLNEPLAWVKRVTRNLSVSRFRRITAEARALVRLGRPPHLQLPEPALELWAAVRALPPRQREVVALCFLEGYTRAEAAEELGVGSETVKTHLERARAALTARLEEHT